MWTDPATRKMRARSSMWRASKPAHSTVRYGGGSSRFWLSADALAWPDSVVPAREGHTKRFQSAQGG